MSLSAVGFDLGLIFNYQLTNLPNYQILREDGTVCINNEYKILVTAHITALPTYPIYQILSLSFL